MPPPLPELGSQALVLLSIGFFGLVPDYTHLFRKSCCRACLCIYTQAAFGKAGAVQSIAAAGGKCGASSRRERRELLAEEEERKTAPCTAWPCCQAPSTGLRHGKGEQGSQHCSKRDLDPSPGLGPAPGPITRTISRTRTRIWT